MVLDLHPSHELRYRSFEPDHLLHQLSYLLLLHLNHQLAI